MSVKTVAVRCKTLSGEIYDVEVQTSVNEDGRGGEIVRTTDILKKISDSEEINKINKNADDAKIFYNGRLLTREGSIYLQLDNEREINVTIVLAKKKKKKKAANEENLQDASESKADVQMRNCPDENHKLNEVRTLLPGYALRPSHSSPLKRSKTDRTDNSPLRRKNRDMSTDTNEDVCVRRCLSNVLTMSGNSSSRSTLAPPDGPNTTVSVIAKEFPIGQHSIAKEGHTNGDNIQSSSPPLPPSLDRLHEIFRCLNVISSFLQKQRVQTTWENVKHAFTELILKEVKGEHADPSGNVKFKSDIEDMALFCPEIVGLRFQKRFGDGDDDFIIDFHGGSQLADDVLNASSKDYKKLKSTEATDGSKKLKRRRISSRDRETIFRAALVRATSGILIQNSHTEIAPSQLYSSAFSWPLAFDVKTITLEQLRRAAKSTFSKFVLPESPLRPPQAIKNIRACSSTEKLSPKSFLEHLRKTDFYTNQIKHIENISCRDVQYGTTEFPLSPKVRKTIDDKGIPQLFCHQACAIDAIRKGGSLVVSTSTSSGKSLCYNIPILEALERNQECCAIYIFPTKALAQDQCRNLKDLVKRCGYDPGIVTVYDGDTPETDRAYIRSTAQLLITNPDMLHVSVLPVHRQFERFLRNLEFCVLDEGHSYRGIFGSHVGMVMRRLRRLSNTVYNFTRNAGEKMQFIVCSATIANPKQHASTLTGIREADFSLIDNDGSPRGNKSFILWNPPLSTEAVQTKRQGMSGRAKSEERRASRQQLNQSRHAGVALGSVSEPDWRTQARLGHGHKRGFIARNDFDLNGTVNSRIQDPYCDSTANASGGLDSRLPGRDWRERYGAAGVSKQERRSSPMVEMAMILAECVKHGLQTIAFCKTRKLCELVLAYTRQILLDIGHKTSRNDICALASRLAVYRSGYSAAERRSVETSLSSGHMIAVAATNALELGIDIGDLDCTLHLGYPGTIASLWQQSGRAGRRRQDSLGIFVAFDGPLDQYFMTHPQKLFGRPIETAHIDLSNPQLLLQHISCASFEKEIDMETDIEYLGQFLKPITIKLQNSKIVSPHPTRNDQKLYHVGGGTPARGVSLRAIDPERYSIIDESTGQIIEEIEQSKAFYEVYDGAVYLYNGKPYLCKKLDLTSRVAVVRLASVKYYTQIRDYTDVHVVGGSQLAYDSLEQIDDESNADCVCNAKSTNAVVTTRWMGFHRIWHGTGQVFDTVDLFLPDMSFSTQAVFLRLHHSVRLKLERSGLPFREGVHAACHAILNVVPLFVMCNPEDLRTECDNPYDSRYRPERLLLFDAHPGGIGLSVRIRPHFFDIMAKALELIQSCDCKEDCGCPGCVQFTHCTEYNSVIHKNAGAEILKLALNG